MRLFVAIEPSAQARAAIAPIRDRLKARCDAAGVKTSFPKLEDLHLTLRFLGEVEEAKVPGIASALAPIGATDRLEIAFSGLGAFGGKKNPRVVWLGVSRGGELLKSLAEQVDRCLAEAGFEPEARQFRAHLTLARVRRASKNTTSVLDPVSPEGVISSPVHEVVLFRSDLGPGGARYTPLIRIPLAQTQ